MPRKKVKEGESPTTDTPVTEPTQASALQPLPNPPAADEDPARKIPDPYKIARDTKAGVELLECRRYRQMQLKFDEKPSQEAIAAVKGEGYRWNGKDQVWTKQIQQDTAMETRIDAERLFKLVADMIRQEKGVAGRTV